MTIEFLDLTFGPGREIDTRRGPRILSAAEPTEKFWNAWRADKERLKQAGFAVGKDRLTGEWQVNHWHDPNREPGAVAARNEAVAARNEAVEASRAVDAPDLDVPAPDGLEYRPFQRAGISYAMARDGVLIADEMGLGKTIQAIGVLNADPSIKTVLVICPASLKRNWQRELEKWSVRPIEVGIAVGKLWPALTGNADVEAIVANYDILTKHADRLRRPVDLLIVDEAHYCKNPKAARTKAILGDKKAGWFGIQARRRVFLTGTPVVNRPIELWPLVESLDGLGLGRSFFPFAKRYCNAHKKSIGRGRMAWDFTGASNLAELQEKLRTSIMVRRLKADVLTELPAKIRQVIEIDPNGAAGAVEAERAGIAEHKAALVEAAAAVAAAKLGDDNEAYETAVSDLRALEVGEISIMSKLRHDTALAKVPSVIAHLTDALEAGPVVCFAWHRDVIAEIAAAFEGRCGIITGDTPLDERQRVVDAFQAGEIDLFLGNIRAAGVGLTLVRSSHVVFAELDWTPGNVSQAEDRCHRIGQTDSVTVHHLVLDGSLDATLAKTLVRKQAIIDAAMDKGVETIDPGEPVVPLAEIETSILAELDKPEVIERLAREKVPDEEKAAIMTALRRLAEVCDGAVDKDGYGFNATDTHFGRALAAGGSLTDRQAGAARKMLRKYRRQLGDGLVASMGEG